MINSIFVPGAVFEYMPRLESCNPKEDAGAIVTVNFVNLRSGVVNVDLNIDGRTYKGVVFEANVLDFRKIAKDDD